ncbi:MAG: glycosyltransferase family 4 protein [Nitrosomonadales bacterium]|nr:glycosyltransferase family 4 protein [Nitrosomonadales bacterium]
MIYYVPIVSVLVTLSLIAAILSSKFGKKIQDIPNERSLHSAPIPRIGGIGLMAGVLSGWTLMLTSLVWWLVLPLIGLFIVSLLDDMRGLPVRQRMLAHVVAAAILVEGSGLLTGQNIVIALAALLFMVWMTNLYNFMDGSDGLAGGMALFGFTTYGIAALTGDNNIFAMLNFSIGAAALGFLYYNFPPAKVFMGDAGSIPLGFLAAAMGVWGWQQGYWAVWFPLLVFSPFVVDASVTLVRRTLCRARITEAHREHYYQRAILMGFGHRNTAFAEYALMLLVGVSALWGIGLDVMSQAKLLAWWCAIYSGLLMWIDRRWQMHQARQENTDVA